MCFTYQLNGKDIGFNISGRIELRTNAILLFRLVLYIPDNNDDDNNNNSNNNNNGVLEGPLSGES